MPHQAHTAHPLPIQFGLNPLRNASFQSLTLRNRRQNLLVCTLTSASGAGVGVCPVPEGSGSKRQLLMDGWEIHGQLRALKLCTAQSHTMQGQTARHHNWIPNPCHSTKFCHIHGLSFCNTRMRQARNTWESYI